MIALLRIRIISNTVNHLDHFSAGHSPQEVSFRLQTAGTVQLSNHSNLTCVHTLILSQETSSTYSGSSSGRSAAGSGSSGSGSGYCPSNAGSSDSGRSQGRYHGIPGPAYGGMYGDPRDKGKWNSEFSSISTVISLCH